MSKFSITPLPGSRRGIISHGNPPPGQMPRQAGLPVQRPSVFPRGPGQRQGPVQTLEDTVFPANPPPQMARTLEDRPQEKPIDPAAALQPLADLPPVELPERDISPLSAAAPSPAPERPAWGPEGLMEEYLRPAETDRGRGPLLPEPEEPRGPLGQDFRAAAVPTPVPDPRMPRVIPVEERREKEPLFYERKRRLLDEITQIQGRLGQAKEGEFLGTDALIKTKNRRATFKKRGDARLAAEDAVLMRHMELSQDAAALARKWQELQAMEDGGLEAWIRGQDFALAGPPPPDRADYETWLEKRSPEEAAGRILIENDRARQRAARELGKMQAAEALRGALRQMGYLPAFGEAATTAWDKGLVRGEDGRWTTPQMGRTEENLGAMGRFVQGTSNFTQGIAARMGKQSTVLDPVISSLQKQFGISDADMMDVWSDLQLEAREWEPEEMLRVTSTGLIIPGGTNSGWMDRARAEAAIRGATASETSKADMLERIPQIQQNIMDRKFRGYEMAAGLIQDLSVENPAPVLERLEKEGKLSPRTREALELAVRTGLLAPGTGGIKTPSRWAEETGRIHYAYEPQALLDYEREVLESNPVARQAWGILGNVVLGFGDIAAQGTAIAGMMGHEGSRKVAGELAEATGDISAGLDAGLAGNIARLAPQVIAQLVLTKGAGTVAGTAGAGARGTAIAGFTANTVSAGVQSATGTYAQAIAEGDSHEKAMSKAGAAGLNSMMVAGVFNLKGAGGTATALGKRKAAELTMRDLTEMAAERGMGNLARSKEMRTMMKQMLTAYGMEATESVVETMLQTYATADPDDNLSDVLSEGLRSIAEGAIAGTGIRLIQRNGGGNRGGGGMPQAANGVMAGGNAGTADAGDPLLQRTDASLREYDARRAAEAAAAASGSPERTGDAAGAASPASPAALPQPEGSAAGAAAQVPQAAGAAEGAPGRMAPAAGGGGTQAGAGGGSNGADGLPKRESPPEAAPSSGSKPPENPASPGGVPTVGKPPEAAHPQDRGAGGETSDPAGKAPERKPAEPDPAAMENIDKRIREADPEAPPATADEVAAGRELTGGARPREEGGVSSDQDIAAAPGRDGPVRSDAGTAAAEAAEGVRIHRQLNAEADRAAAAMSDAEATKRRARSEGDTRTAERAEQDLRRARQDYARVPRARGASKLANGVPLDSLAPGEKRALGLGPEGFPLDGEALAETGLDKPLVSLGPDGKPVLSPAAAEEVARVSPELARRMEATERDVSEQPAAAEGDPEATMAAPSPDSPPPSPDLSRGRPLRFRQGDAEVAGQVISPIAGGGLLVQTADGPVVINTADITGMGSGTGAGQAHPRPGSGTRGASKGPPLSPPRAGRGDTELPSTRKGDKVAFRLYGENLTGTVLRSLPNGKLVIRTDRGKVTISKRHVTPIPRRTSPPRHKAATKGSLKAADIPGNNPKPLSDWLADQPELLEEARRLFRTEPQWQGIDPDSALVFYRPQGEVREIRAMKGEGPGHHPHGLALGGMPGQKLTYTGDKLGQPTSPKHVEANKFQSDLRKAIIRKLGL